MYKSKTNHLTLTSLLIGIGVILPMFFHLFNLGGAMFLPMHIPVLICGFLLGKKYGFLCGLIVPLLSSFLTGMPPFFPVAIVMSIELATYGYSSGYLSKKYNLFTSLIITQILGRLIGALTSFILLSLAARPFTLSLYLTGAFLTAFPGIVIQWIFIPIIIRNIKRRG